MNAHVPILACVVIGGLQVAGTASAQFEARAEVDAPIAGTSREDPAAAATIVAD